MESIHLETAFTASYEALKKSNEHVLMMHVKIVKPSPRFEPPTLGKVSKHATK
jgi:hypothetical protein